MNSPSPPHTKTTRDRVDHGWPMSGSLREESTTGRSPAGQTGETDHNGARQALSATDAIVTEKCEAEVTVCFRHITAKRISDGETREETVAIDGLPTPPSRLRRARTTPSFRAGTGRGMRVIGNHLHCREHGQVEAFAQCQTHFGWGEGAQAMAFTTRGVGAGVAGKFAVAQWLTALIGQAARLR